jgi:indolepyruvate ferredoxin oxidoreductase beta subunit
MKCDIILSGVGGQGILSIAASIGMAALKANLEIKQSEVHGMSQRGGAVQSHLRISDKPIASDLIPLSAADIIISVEPMESLRYLPYLSKTGWLVTNSVPFINIPNYPDESLVLSEINKLQKFVLINADEIAERNGNSRALNMVMLGAASPFIDISEQYFKEGISNLFRNKGEQLIQSNLNAFDNGRGVSLEKLTNLSEQTVII